MNTKGADTKSTLHRGETGVQKGLQKRKSVRRDSSLSSFSVSESDNSDDTSSSSSEEEEEEEEAEDTFMDTSAPPKLPHPEPTATIKMEDTSVLSQHHPHQYPHQQQQQSDGGGMVSGSQPPGALVVRIPLVLVQNQQLHKPKVSISAWIRVRGGDRGGVRYLTTKTRYDFLIFQYSCIIRFTSDLKFFSSCIIRFSSQYTHTSPKPITTPHLSCPLQATVAPTVVNPPNKAPGRRLTMDATEHEVRSVNSLSESNFHTKSLPPRD